MVTGAGSLALKGRGATEQQDDGPAADTKRGLAQLRIQVSSRLADVEADWRVLEAEGLQSPSQSFDFNKVWVETLEIESAQRLFVTIATEDEPLLAMAFKRCRLMGARVACPLSGRHVGTNSPLLNRTALARMTAQVRSGMIERLLAQLDVDIVVLPHILRADAEFLTDSGHQVDAEHLYRAHFSSWAECDREQRSRSRRKHDKQQANKLAALGEVSFEEVSSPAEVTQILDILFKYRAARFDGLGIADPFAPAQIRAFYRTIFNQSDVLRGVAHVLRVDGDIVAVRYNLVAGEKMFCLISGMITTEEMLPGSPGKQILVHIMQHVFDHGIAVFDLGSGFSDEKRHWCNERLPLTNVYLPATLKGRAVARMLISLARLKSAVKSNRKLFDFLKIWRARLARRKQHQL